MQGAILQRHFFYFFAFYAVLGLILENDIKDLTKVLSQSLKESKEENEKLKKRIKDLGGEV